MPTLAILEWGDDFVLTRDLQIPGDRTAFYARIRRGEYVAVTRGVYIPAHLWSDMDGTARYMSRVRSIALSHGQPLLFSHLSAAAIWGLPNLSAWPRRVEVLSSAAPGGRSSSTVFRHTVGIPDEVVKIDGLRVTSLERTVVDLCRTLPHADAVVFADAALRRSTHPVVDLPQTLVDRAALLCELDLVPASRGTARARAAITFADAAADRPGESISRVNIHAAGLTRPRLQAPLRGASGRVWTVDFWWEEFNLIGEFDGKAKYSDPEFLRGRTPQQAVYDEKLREDDLRAAGHGMTRWPWGVATSMPRLRGHLIAAGVR
jgi:hypothetical protein